VSLSNLQLNSQFVQAVRDAVDIVDVASGYTKLARAGRKWKGLCPLHKEKTPSFNVDADLGFFKCFGCGAGGDAIKLHMLLTGDDFPAAMEALASRFGVPINRLGLTMSYAEVKTLRDLAGTAGALEVLLAGDVFDSKRAYELGLVYKVTADGELLATAEALASASPARAERRASEPLGPPLPIEPPAIPRTPR